LKKPSPGNVARTLAAMEHDEYWQMHDVLNKAPVLEPEHVQYFAGRARSRLQQVAPIFRPVYAADIAEAEARSDGLRLVRECLKLIHHLHGEPAITAVEQHIKSKDDFGQNKAMVRREDLQSAWNALGHGLTDTERARRLAAQWGGRVQAEVIARRARRMRKDGWTMDR